MLRMLSYMVFLIMTFNLIILGIQVISVEIYPVCGSDKPYDVQHLSYIVMHDSIGDSTQGVQERFLHMVTSLVERVTSVIALALALE